VFFKATDAPTLLTPLQTMTAQLSVMMDSENK